MEQTEHEHEQHQTWTLTHAQAKQLAQWIREGEQYHPQCFEVTRSTTYDDRSDAYVTSTCAIAGAYVAAHPDHTPITSLAECANYLQQQLGGLNFYYTRVPYPKGYEDPDSDRPICSLLYLIAQTLSDKYHWDREQIAAYVETLGSEEKEPPTCSN